LRVSSRSSGRMCSKEVTEALVWKPVVERSKKGQRGMGEGR
jgi:hypothetical protein